MRAYAILVVEKSGEVHLSQEAYSSLDDAHRFIKSRVPEPGRLGMMKFRDAEGREYIIHDLRVTEPSVSAEIPTGGLPNRHALREFLDSREVSLTLNGASEARRAGKALTFLYCDQEAYGDRSYYFCEEDGKVYSDYFSIGD